MNRYGRGRRRCTGARRRALGALAALGAVLVAGCYIETLDGVPRYPGAAIGPGYRLKDGSLTSLKQTYYTSDPYPAVVEYYGRILAQESGWRADVHADLAIWTNNMKPHSAMMAAAPLDAAHVGKLLVIVDEGTRTTIRAFSSHPGT